MPEPLPVADEDEVVWHWRYDAARDAGLSKAASRMLADHEIEANEIRRLVRLGYTPQQIFKLLR